MKKYIAIIVGCLVTVIVSIGMVKYNGEDFISFQAGNIKGVIVNNAAYGNTHKNKYNGIAELFHVKQDSNLFVPEFAGFNLEHIFGGDSLVHLFEPRHAPMQIEKKSAQKILLHQPETSISHLESWIEYQLVPPHYIDIKVRFKAHDKVFFNHNYIGLFFASYINAPGDKSIYFQGKSGSKESSHWIKSFSPEHGFESTILSDDDSLQPYMAPDFNVTLANHFSRYRYTSPFYYGKFDNMVFAYLFSKQSEGIIRFSQSPDGAGPENPAWDFYYIVPDYKVGKEYSFKVRLLYKEWISKKDIESEYQKWLDQ